MKIPRYVQLPALLAALMAAPSSDAASAVARDERPNIVLCMTDDQGWGDVGYNGHPVLKTPGLDAMAAAGLRLNRFYAAHPQCSPTRGSVLTGRHPIRYGCFRANMSIRPEEITLGEALKTAGYATGHFGKWHVGPVKAGSPLSPMASGFDESLSHDNWFDLDPQLCRNGGPPQTHAGEPCEIITEAAVEFIRKQSAAGRPFLAIVWFPSPHEPGQSAEKYKKPYKHLSSAEQNYYGEMAAVDASMGFLRRSLRELGIAGHTLLWFKSDNGPYRNDPGSAGGLRGWKLELWEGGIRVPGIVEWPSRIKRPMVSEVPCSTQATTLPRHASVNQGRYHVVYAYIHALDCARQDVFCTGGFSTTKGCEVFILIDTNHENTFGCRVADTTRTGSTTCAKDHVCTVTD
jgi:arylsulfatase A-like enzyme